nr:MAG TPA: hypothetical protein [Caudoviricetes sp.]
MTPAALPDGPPSRKVLSVPYCRLFRPYTSIVRASPHPTHRNRF